MNVTIQEAIANLIIRRRKIAINIIKPFLKRFIDDKIPEDRISDEVYKYIFECGDCFTETEAESMAGVIRDNKNLITELDKLKPETVFEYFENAGLKFNLNQINALIDRIVDPKVPNTIMMMSGVPESEVVSEQEVTPEPEVVSEQEVTPEPEIVSEPEEISTQI